MMERLTGEDYPWLCQACQSVVDQVAELIHEMPDEYASDPEGPCNWAYDHAMFCGGRHCKEDLDERKHSAFCTKCRGIIPPDKQYYICYEDQRAGQDKVCQDCMRSNKWVYVEREDTTELMAWRGTPEYVALSSS